MVFDRYFSLGLILVLSVAATILLFVGTNHYYAVDARYLTIVLFAFFICGALLTRNHNWTDRRILIIGGLLGLGVAFGIASCIQLFNQQSNALAEIKERNSLVAQALKSNPADVLVGDYWRVFPIM